MFIFTCRFLKYLLLAGFGVAIACLLSASFGNWHITNMIVSWFGQWLWRLLTLAFCVVTLTVVVESLR